MDKMEDLMKGLQLSDAEKKKVHIGMGSATISTAESAPQKAFGKLLSDRRIHSEVIEQSVGWIL
jgi:hypothetical protein